MLGGGAIQEGGRFGAQNTRLRRKKGDLRQTGRVPVGLSRQAAESRGFSPIAAPRQGNLLDGLSRSVYRERSCSRRFFTIFGLKGGSNDLRKCSLLRKERENAGLPTTYWRQGHLNATPPRHYRSWTKSLRDGVRRRKETSKNPTPRHKYAAHAATQAKKSKVNSNLEKVVLETENS